MNAPSPVPEPAVIRRNRTMLLVIVGLFFGTLLVAGVLRFSGWQPPATQAHGELLQPPVDLRVQVPHLADGRAYPWEPAARIWRIVVAPAPGCVAACIALSRQLDKVWRLLGQDSDRVHVLWLGEPPAGATRFAALRVLADDPALRMKLPRALPAPGEASAGVPVYVVDPNGFVILRYAPGFDPGGLRTDMAKLLKLM
jgi:hypothetical protein